MLRQRGSFLIVMVLSVKSVKVVRKLERMEKGTLLGRREYRVSLVFGSLLVSVHWTVRRKCKSVSQCILERSVIFSTERKTVSTCEI